MTMRMLLGARKVSEEWWRRPAPSPYFAPLLFFGGLPNGELARHSDFFLTPVSGQLHARYSLEEQLP